MANFSWLDAFFEGKMDEVEVGRKANKLIINPLDMLAAAAAVFERQEKTESNHKMEVSFDAAVHEAAMPMLNHKSIRFVMKRKRSSSSDSSRKKPKTHFNGNTCSVSDEDHLFLPKQGTWEIGNSSDFTSSSSYSGRKKVVKKPKIFIPRQPKKKKKVQKQKAKKKKIIYRGPKNPPGLPDQFRTIINERGGTDIQMLIQKPLFQTDVSHHHSRLSMPISQIVSENFLTEPEKDYLKNNGPMTVELIDTKLNNIVGMTLSWWKMAKSDGKSNPTYVLNHEWKNLMVSNKLELGNIIQVWTFRIGLELNFALVFVEKGEPGDDDVVVVVDG